MRKLALLAVLVLPWAIVGCCDAVLRTAAETIEADLDNVLPEYEQYVRNDPALDETEEGITSELAEQRKKTKAAKLDSAASLKKTLKVMKED